MSSQDLMQVVLIAMTFTARKSVTSNKCHSILSKYRVFDGIVTLNGVMITDMDYVMTTETFSLKDGKDGPVRRQLDAAPSASRKRESKRNT